MSVFLLNSSGARGLAPQCVKPGVSEPYRDGAWEAAVGSFREIIGFLYFILLFYIYYVYLRTCACCAVQVELRGQPARVNALPPITWVLEMGLGVPGLAAFLFGPLSHLASRWKDMNVMSGSWGGGGECTGHLRPH